MKKKITALLLITALALSGCGSSEAPAETSNAETRSETTADESVEVDKNLLTVEITVPASYVENATQEDLDKIAEEEGFKSITLNEDGSATYVMTKAQHEEMMDEMVTVINDSMTDMINSEDYPTYTNITANDNFTEFTITTTSSELSFNESFSVLVFYMYGGMYNAFNGTPVDNIHIDFVNAKTGEIITSCNSSDMESTEEATE